MPLEQAAFFKCNSLDSLRAQAKELRPGRPVIGDELQIADRVQIQYMSEAGIKALLNVARPADLRAREHQVVLHARTPRVFTCNCETLEEWVGDRADLRDCIPIFRRAFVFKCEQRHLKLSSVLALRTQRSEEDDNSKGSAMHFF